MKPGDGTPENPGTIGKFHENKDGTVGWDTYSPEGDKIHIRCSDVSKDDDKNRNMLTTLLGALFGKNGE